LIRCLTWQPRPDEKLALLADHAWVIYELVKLAAGHGNTPIRIESLQTLGVFAGSALPLVAATWSSLYDLASGVTADADATVRLHGIKVFRVELFVNRRVFLHSMSFADSSC
jgi:hypothetical protein